MTDIYEALYKASQEYPYYARGFAALTPVKLSNFPTFAVDQYWRLYYSDLAIEQFKYSNIAAIMCHELEHLLRDHTSRCNNRSNNKWNYACDAEINDDIENLPEDGIRPKTFNLVEGLTAEEYYNQIPDTKISPLHGSGTGTPGEWELEAPSSSEQGLTSKEEVDQLREKIANDILTNREAGTIPNYVLIWAEVTAKGKLPKIKWDSILRRRVRKIVNGRSDYQNTKISRRQEPTDKILLAGKISYEPTIITVIDTSGSMVEHGDWAAGCLKSITNMFKNNKLIDCDSEVHRTSKLKSWREIIHCIGGGGTDMRKGVGEALKQKADIILLLTDGYTPWPEKWPRNLIAILPDYTIKYSKNYD